MRPGMQPADQVVDPSAGEAQSITPSSFVRRWAYVASASSCASFDDVDRRRGLRSSRPARRRRCAPDRVRRRRWFRRGPIGRRAVASIGPASSALTTRMIVMPVSRSPAMIGAMHRRGPPVARQQRRVDVDHARGAARPARASRQDLAVGRDDAEIGVERRQLRDERRVLHRVGLQDRQRRQPMADALTGACGRLLAASSRSIRLRDDADDGMARGEQRLEGRHGERRACRRRRSAAARASTICPRA